MLFRCYFDDSADDATKLFGVGGFVGPDAVWDELQSQWLKALPAGIEFFHATDCFSGNNQFEPKRGFSVERRITLLDLLVGIVCRSDIKLICRVIDVPKYVRFAPKRIENDFLGNQYVACVDANIQTVCRDYMSPPGQPSPVETGDVCAIFY